MVQITITGVNPSGRLVLSDNGNSSAKRNEDVHWKVNDRTGRVRGIEDIAWKSGNPDPNNFNIFSNNPPAAQGSSPTPTHWKGIVNKHQSDAPDGAKYHYGITWSDASGNQHNDDPIISIRPSGIREYIDIVTVGMAALGLAAFLFWSFKSRQKERKANEAALHQTGA